MKSNQDLSVKPSAELSRSHHPVKCREIWMLQFSDGTHVEFVSPRQRPLRRQFKREKASI